MINELTIFSYSRIDSEFVLKLATDLRNSHANIWLDQLDVEPGSHWDQAIENAMRASKCVIVVLSPNSINSNNVMDEVSYALEEGKRVVPILFKDCSIPLRLRRLQYIDFRTNYALSFDQLIRTLHLEEELIPEHGKKDSEIKQNDAEALRKAEEEEKERVEQLKEEAQRKVKEEKEKLEQLKAEALRKEDEEKEILKQLKAEALRKAEEEKNKRASELVPPLNQPSFESKNEPPESPLIKISKIKRKKRIILYAGILSLFIIIIAGYFIFKRKTFPPVPDIPNGTTIISPIADPLTAINTLVDQKKYEEAKQMINMLPADKKSQPEVAALINRIKELEINKEIDSLNINADRLLNIANQLRINKNYCQAKRMYIEALNNYKKTLSFNHQNNHANIEIQRNTEILRTVSNLCDNPLPIHKLYDFTIKSSARRDVDLKSIGIAENETEITLEVRPTEDPENSFTIYSPDSNPSLAFIIEYYDPVINVKKKIRLKEVKGIQTGISIKGKSSPTTFQLIFGRLPDNVNQFNLIEGEDRVEGRFNFIGIKLKR